MTDERFYSRAEVHTLLTKAMAKTRPEVDQYTLQEVMKAARAACIDEQRVASAAERVSQRSSVRAAIVVVGCGAAVLVAGLLAVPARSLRGWRHDSLLIENGKFHQAYEVQVLVPKPLERDATPSNRPQRADDYCLWRTVRLEPRSQRTVPIPQSSGCVWVRAYVGSTVTHTATFDLPAGVEIEAFGGLDQKGFGHPNMHPAPQDWDAPAQPCAAFPQGATTS